MLVKLMTVVVISSLIGWLTNYVAIKMLFRPYKEINLIFFKIQGLIPKRKREIGESIAEIVQSEVISIKDIIANLDREEISSKIENIIDDLLNDNLESEIKARFPMLAMFLNSNLIDKIKNIIKEAIISKKEIIIDSFVVYIEENIDFKQIIKDNVDSFSLEKLEEVTFSLAKKELKHIEIIGAILGAIIGFVQFFVVNIF